MRHLVAWTILAVFALTSFAEPRPFLERLKDGRPFLIGHRGRNVLKYGGKFAENTLGSFQAARAGLQAIETDVRLTADGALVCSHDANLKRVFKVDLAIGKSTLAEIRKHPVPTFDAYLDVCTRYDAVPFIETKGDVAVVAPVVDVLRKRGLIKVAVLSSSDFAHIRAARRLDPDLFVHHIFSKPELLDELASMGNAGLSWNYPDLAKLPAGLIERTHAKGVRCCLRACDSPATYQAMRALKLDYYPTNVLVPDELAETAFRLQAYVHDLVLKDGAYVATFNLGRSDAAASAPVRLAWKGAPGAVYAVAVNGHDLGTVSGEACAVVAPKACGWRDPNRLEIRVVEGEDKSLCDPDRIAVSISVPAERGPHLSLHGFLERLALPLDLRDEAAAAKAFAQHVRATYRAEPEVLARYRGADDPAAWKRSVDRGRRALDYSFEEVGSWYTFPDRRVAWQFNPTRNGYNEWCFHFSCFSWSGYLATYYAKTGDERAAETWRDLCLSFFAEETVPESKNGYGTSTWRSLDSSERLSHLMGDLAVFLKSPAVTDEFLVTFFRSMWEHAHRLRTSHAWGGNWFSNEMTCLYRFTYLMPYFKDNDEWRAYALAAVTRELKGQVYPDGQQNELAGGYHASVARQFLRIPAVCRFAGVEPPAELMSTVERMFDPYMVLMRPDGRIPGLNDSTDRKAAPFLALGAQLFPARADMKWFASEGVEGARPGWLSRTLPYMGAAVMRTTWEKDAVWAYMDCGPFGTGHQHEDKLNVLLCAYGRTLLSEGGFYDYDTSEIRKYVLSTRSHNTVRFDGGDQDRRAGYRWNPADIARKADFEFSTTPALDVAAAAYDEAYARSPGSGLKHARRLMLFKQVPGLDPFLVVVDRYSATDGRPHAFEQLWHLADGALARLGERAFLATYKGDVGLAGAFSDPEARLVDKRGQKEPELQGWDPGEWSRNNAAPIATPVLCGTFTGARRVVAALQPLRQAGGPCVRAVKASADAGDTAFTLVLSDGREIALQE